MMDKRIKINFTSDLHGYYFPTDFRSPGEVEMGLLKCENQFQKDEDTLTLDGGDTLQGSPLAAYCHDLLHDASLIADLMNRSDYDIVTIGNHDFNYGLSYLKNYLSSLHARCTCVNLVDREGNIPFPAQKVTMKNGIRIGLIGLVTEYVMVWEKEENLGPFIVDDVLESGKKAIEKLRGQVDLLIGIYHGGFERDLESRKIFSETKENRAFELAKKLDFDLLLTGHQHRHIEGREIAGTYVVQPDAFGREFVQIEVVFHGEEKKITSFHRRARGEIAREKAQAFNFLETGSNQWLNELVGKLDHPIPVKDPLSMAVKGSPLADFYNQVQLSFSGADLSATSLANEVVGLPARVCRRDLFIAYPYSNTFVVLEVTGKLLREALERSASYFDLDPYGKIVISDRFLKPKVEHYNYDYYAGLDYAFDISQPIGKRVVKMQRKGAPIRDDEIFTLCLNSYRASGTGGYDFYQSCPLIREYSQGMLDLLLDFFNSGKSFFPGQCKEPLAFVSKKLLP